MSSIGFDSGANYSDYSSGDYSGDYSNYDSSDLQATAGDYSNTDFGTTVGDAFSNIGGNIGDAFAGLGNGIGSAIGGVLDGVGSIASALGINPNRMGSTIMQGLARNLIGGATNTSGLTTAQLTNLLKSTTFQNSSPAQQADYVRMMQRGGSQLGANGGVDPWSTTGNAALGSGSGALGSTPGIGSFGADSANGNAKEALRNFMLMKGMDAGDVDKAISNPDPSVRMAMWGQMMTYNEQNQKAWFDTLSNLIKIYGEMASNINGKMGQI